MRMRIAVLLMLAAALAAPAWAARHKVQVKFDIVPEHDFYARFRQGGRLTDIEIVRRSIIDALLVADKDSRASRPGLLQDLIGFVEFVTDEADYQLRIDIADGEGAHGTGQREVFFRIALLARDPNERDPGLKFKPMTRSPLYWRFREAYAYGHGVTNVENFINEIKVTLLPLLKNRANEIVRTQLRALVIADNAFCLRDRGEFILPLAAEDLRVGNETVFEIHAEIADDIGTGKADYSAKFAGNLSGKSPDLDAKYHQKMRVETEPTIKERLKKLEAVTPTTVWLIYYVPPAEAARP